MGLEMQKSMDVYFITDNMGWTLPLEYITPIELRLHFMQTKDDNKYEIRDTITRIPDNSLKSTQTLPKFKIATTTHSNLEYIGRSNFENSNIQEFEFPAALNEIEYRAFYHSNIEKIFLKSTPNIRSEAFQMCNSLTWIYCDDATAATSEEKTIDRECFSGCENLKTVHLHTSNFTNINSHAFSQCTNLEIVYLPKTLTYLAENAFEGCTKIQITYEGQTQSVIDSVQKQNSVTSTKPNDNKRRKRENTSSSFQYHDATNI